MLSYWGFKDHPFDDFILKDQSLCLFVDREKQLHKLHNALTGRLCGIYGSQGVGKSSFLRKLEEILKASELSVVYVHLMGTSEKAIYREILAAILRNHISGELKTDPKLKLKAKEELDRVESSIQITSESEFGAQGIIKAGLKRTQKQDFDPHSEETARALIRDVIYNATSPFAVIIDDLERMKHFLENADSYFRFVTSIAKTIDESFSDPKVCFIVSVDTHFVDRINQNLPDDEGAISFSFGDLIKLENFSPQLLIEILKRRLRNRGWKKSLKDFISPEALLMVLATTGGHPRRSLALLRSAMEHIEESRKPLFIDTESIEAAIAQRKEILNRKDLEILFYLQKERELSTSDEKVLAELGLPRSTIRGRLKELAVKLNLTVSEQAIGRTQRTIYSFPNFSLD